MAAEPLSRLFDQQGTVRAMPVSVLHWNKQHKLGTVSAPSESFCSHLQAQWLWASDVTPPSLILLTWEVQMMTTLPLLLGCGEGQVSDSTESPQDRGKLLFMSVAITMMTLVMAMLDPIPTSPLLSLGVESPRLCHQGGASFLLTGLVILKPTSWRRDQGFLASSCSARPFSTAGD